jgi:tyrosine-protein phosphatase SIW14
VTHRARPSQTWTTAAFLVVSLMIPAAARSGQVDLTKAKVQIDNFGRVSPAYYRGAQPKSGDFGDLAALGIHTVIDLTKDGDTKEPSVVQSLGMKFYRIPMTTRETPSAETIALFLGLVNDPANQPVYVHCQGGRHRTGLMTALYRMTHEGWSGDKAFAEMKQYKFGADYLHPEFKRFVLNYHPDATIVAGITAASSANAVK